MWIKRFVIIIPTLQVPLEALEFGTYTPSWVEISIISAGFAGFILILAISTKVMPIMPLVEMTEEAEAETAHHTGESGRER